jgi:hypothetical protein
MALRIPRGGPPVWLEGDRAIREDRLPPDRQRQLQALRGAWHPIFRPSPLPAAVQPPPLVVPVFNPPPPMPPPPPFDLFDDDPFLGPDPEGEPPVDDFAQFWAV